MSMPQRTDRPSGPPADPSRTPIVDAKPRPCIAAEVCAAIGAPALVFGVYVLRADVQPLFIAWGVMFVLMGVVFSLLALGQVLNLCE